MRKMAKRKGIVKMWTVVLVIAGVIAAGLGGGLLYDASSRREIQQLEIDTESFRKLHDGIYVGQYRGSKGHLRDARVEVTVASGKVSSIKVLKGAVDAEGKPVKLKGELTIEDLFNKVINSQSLQVDTISGATLTSKTHLKAVEDALEQASQAPNLSN